MNTEYVNQLDFFLFTAHENDSSFMLSTLTTRLLSKSDLTHLERWFLWYRKGKYKVFGLQRGLWTLGYFIATDKCKNMRSELSETISNIVLHTRLGFSSFSLMWQSLQHKNLSCKSTCMWEQNISSPHSTP